MWIKKLLSCIIIGITLFAISSCTSKNNTDENSGFEVSPDIIENKQVPQQDGIITDLENLFDNNAKERLLQKIKTTEEICNIPICIHSTASMEPFDTFTEYADNVGSQWDYCKEEEGILFIISSFLGELRVISCTKTETQISDKNFEYMINDILYESFRENNFEEGLNNALSFLETILNKS